MSDHVKFFALINNEFFRLQVSRDSTLRELYENSCILRRRGSYPDVSYYSCKFYRLQIPVPLPGPNTDEELEIRTKTCVDKTNSVEVKPETTYVRDLGKTFDAESAMLVIDVPLAHRKRPRAVSSIARRVKGAKINEYDPSNIGVAEYREMQANVAWRILDHRKVAGDVGDILDDKVPPVSLLYQPFGDFFDTYFGYSGNRGPGEFTFKLDLIMKNKVDELATVAEMVYRTEGDRIKIRLLRLLNATFSTVLGTDHRQLAAGTDSEPKTDGHSTAPGGEPICIVGFKNELAGINTSIPIAQLLRYYIELIQMAKAYPDVLSSSRMPTLGITFVVITFYAIVCLGGEFYHTTLTPGLSCAKDATNGEDRQCLYRAFSAASTLLRQLTQTAMSPELPTPPVDPFYPVITELPSIDPSGTGFRFTINVSHVVSIDRHVYRATCSDGSELVIKFTSRYSVDLHEHCASQGHAPRLRGFARLPGGIYGIAMDAVGDARSMTADDPLDDRKKWAAQLQLLMNSFHVQGYVHGDLRLPNILIAEGNVMLVDFDWGGREGDVNYPHGHLAWELTAGRIQDDPKITKGDDQRVLRFTLWQIQIDLKGHSIVHVQW